MRPLWCRRSASPCWSCGTAPGARAWTVWTPWKSPYQEGPWRGRRTWKEVSRRGPTPSRTPSPAACSSCCLSILHPPGSTVRPTGATSSAITLPCMSECVSICIGIGLPQDIPTNPVMCGAQSGYNGTCIEQPVLPRCAPESATLLTARMVFWNRSVQNGLSLLIQPKLASYHHLALMQQSVCAVKTHGASTTYCEVVPCSIFSHAAATMCCEDSYSNHHLLWSPSMQKILSCSKFSHAATTEAVCGLAVDPQSSPDVHIGPVFVVMVTRVTLHKAALIIITGDRRQECASSDRSATTPIQQ